MTTVLKLTPALFLRITAPAALGVAFLGASAYAGPAKNQELKVSLFGQPCLMVGPFPQTTLKTIHDISPEKLPPEITLEAMKRVREEATGLKGIPQPLEQYRDHLKKRLSAKIAYEEAIREAKKNADPAAGLKNFFSNVREHLPPARTAAFEKEMDAQFTKEKSAFSEGFVANLKARYEGLIQADTEEEFHKAIRLAKIQYNCEFDEGAGDADDDSDDDAEEAPATKASPAAKAAPAAKPMAPKP